MNQPLFTPDDPDNPELAEYRRLCAGYYAERRAWRAHLWVAVRTLLLLVGGAALAAWGLLKLLP